jgi:hypothetical protein
MLRLWILPVLGLIAALGVACGDSGDGPPVIVGFDSVNSLARQVGRGMDRLHSAYLSQE